MHEKALRVGRHRRAAVHIAKVLAHQPRFLSTLGLTRPVIFSIGVGTLDAHEDVHAYALIDRQPPLSAEQIEYGATWQKALAGPGITGGDACQSLDPQDIVQHIVSDCSVCGAMVVAIDHHRRFGSNVCQDPRFVTSMI